jgi:2-polyprenyl-3-methyl-5-hydroxy-6-metoxy-1,4-benzoquinol methylase
MELSSYSVQNGVIHLEPYRVSQFEKSYVGIREKEQRILSDIQVSQLPYLSNHVHTKEWELRQESVERFLDYLPNKKLRVLEIGCGNGWFSNLIASRGDFDVIGTDMNLEELEQAARVFASSEVEWVYTTNVSLLSPLLFDVIVINAAVQYFPSIAELLQSLKAILANNGEVHVLDSPIYVGDQEAQKASRRTKEYYKSMGFPELSEQYFHHKSKDVKGADWLYKPSSLGKLLGKKNPFPWLRFKQTGI